VLLCDIYASREANDPEVSSELLAKRIGERATYCGGLESSAAAVLDELCEGDTLIVMGAGDVFKVTGLLLSEKEKNNE